MQTVLITGANRGIGLALTRHYLLRGATVFATCRDPGKARELQQLQQSYPGKLLLVRLDVTKDDQLEQAFGEVEKRTDHLDVLINNAGILLPTQFVHEITKQDFFAMMEVNTFAPLHVVHTFLPLLQERAGAKIVNLTAVTRPLESLIKRPQVSHMLMASRYALNVLTRLMALELEASGIITVALWPGYVRTELNCMAEAATPPNEAIPKVVDLIEDLTPEHNGHGLLPNGDTFF